MTEKKKYIITCRRLELDEFQHLVFAYNKMTGFCPMLYELNRARIKFGSYGIEDIESFASWIFDCEQEKFNLQPHLNNVRNDFDLNSLSR